MRERTSLSEAQQSPGHIQTRPSRPPRASRTRRRQTFVFQYLLILFVAAFVLLLFTLLMERRNSAEQIDSLQRSVSASQTLENLLAENASLKEQAAQMTQQLEQLEQLERQASALESEAERLAAELEQTKRAMDLFWQIDEAYVRGRFSLCRSLIQRLEEQSLAQSLPAQSTTDNERFSPADRYAEIVKAVS
jgi:DNA repair exonuclease SbcCD ATPase subunit